MTTLRITDETTRAAQEAYVRKLMHQRALLPNTWQTRTKRAELLDQINDALEKFNTYGSNAPT